MNERTFVDTNVLLYADDASHAVKQARALSLLEDGMRSRRAVLSTQVLQEYFVNATKKLGIQAETARESIQLYQRQLTVVIVQPSDIIEAVDLYRLHSLSFWDSLIIQTAKQAGCHVLLTEELQHGQVFGGLRVVNPFLPN